MHVPSMPARRPRIGSLFSGYGGLDLAVEHATGGETVWFSEINEPVARVFSHHWPDAEHLGDITRLDWSTVPPVDILCGGFPCQDVSAVGKGAGLAPGTRSGLWSHMATAIEALQPDIVVIENVRGLLSAGAIRPKTKGATDEDRNPRHATGETATTLRDMESDPWMLGDNATRPLRAMGAVLGDLADLGRNARWIGLPASLAGAPHHRFRVFILAYPQGPVPNAVGVGLLTRRRDLGSGASASGNDRTESSDHRLHSPWAGWLTGQEERLGDPVRPDRDHLRRWGQYAEAVARWEHITSREAPAPAILNEGQGPRPAPAFVEWLMGMPTGWVTDPAHGLTPHQQNTALGNGVLPLQAVLALDSIDR